jgi:hypothetical protein
MTGRKERSAISANSASPIVVAVVMGYGHLRAAHNLAESLHTEVIRMDLPPVAGQEHANRTWLLSNLAALDAGDPSLLDLRLQHWLTDGELARVAWNAYSQLDREGLDRIHRILNTGGRIGHRCEGQRFTPG